MCLEVWILQTQQSRISQAAKQTCKKLLTGALQSIESNSWNLLANPLLFLLEAPADAEHLLCSANEGLSASISANEQPSYPGTAPTHGLVLGGGERRGMKPCHHQYSNGGLFWAADLIKALPGAFHPKLSGRHVHQPHCTERISCSETPSLTEGHTARKWQSWNWNLILNPLPCTLHTSGELWAAVKWETGEQESTI